MNFSSLCSDPAHDCYYSVDSNMVISYVCDDIPGWREYVDRLSQKGRRFFMTSVVYAEVLRGGTVPPVFHLFGDGEGEIRSKMAVPRLLHAFGISADAACARKFANDLQWLLQSGFSISGCADIPELAILSGKALAVTANAKLVRRFLYSPDKRAAFERVVDDCALEHLADVRAVVKSSGVFVDRSAF